MQFVYRLAEGIVLREPVEAPGKLEAWGTVSRRWRVYPEIDIDWMTRSRPITEADVPAEALQAPTSY